MDQTPVHEQHNAELLALIPHESKRLIEIGCSSGALAREFKKIAPASHYTGVEISTTYAELAQRHCDRVLVQDIEATDDTQWAAMCDYDCWIFGDSLEHLRDPWRVLRTVRTQIPAHGCVVACIPNMQHWSIQLRMSVGEFRYEEMGLLDKTHLRWFTRITMVEMFNSAGFKVVQGTPRVFNEPLRAKVLPVIQSMAKIVGGDPEQAAKDATPLQYVLRAVPV